MVTHYRVEGRVGVIRLDNPPVNGLGHATRHGIVTHLRQALASADIDAVVLTGTGGFFSAGADIREFGIPDAIAEPTLSDVISELDAADKPVIAAIDGTCLGGGLELVLGAHYRVATRSSTLGLPEVLLGLVPGAGGTQRLPRAVGAGLAAQMITSGQTRPASEFGDLLGQRLLDKVVDTNAAAAAIELAHTIAELRPLPRLCECAVDSDGALAIDAIRAQVVGRHRPESPAGRPRADRADRHRDPSTRA